ncbi:MAG: dTDP-4-dehydrorhamnose 3,5-epimerase family protein, partial [Gluconobacter oxydans]
MKVERLSIPEVILVTPPRFGDNRGFFSETYNVERMGEAG